VAGSFENDNEPSGSVEWGEFLDCLNFNFSMDYAPWSKVKLKFSLCLLIS
jgi:hypothetical protein